MRYLGSHISDASEQSTTTEMNTWECSGQVGHTCIAATGTQYSGETTDSFTLDTLVGRIWIRLQIRSRCIALQTVASKLNQGVDTPEAIYKWEAIFSLNQEVLHTRRFLVTYELGDLIVSII